MNKWESFTAVPRKFSAGEFAQPDAFYGPVYSWVWNAPVTEAGIREQIDEMARAGIRSFYVIPEPPEFRPTSMITTMTPEYLSPTFFERIRLAVEYGREQGMTVWIYDEGGWPSGSACGQVTKLRPDLASKRLASRTLTLNHAPYAPGEDVLAAFVGKKRIFAGETPETVTEFYLETVSDFIPDLLEPDTVPLFMELTHRRYAEALGDLLDSVVPCVFIDEPNIFMPEFPCDLPERFREEYGYDLLDHLYAVTDPAGGKPRADYCRLIGRLLTERLGKPIQDWCRARGLLFTGHLDKDHDLGQWVNAYAEPFASEKLLDLPGIDVIWNQIRPSDTCPVADGDPFFPRLAPSAASQSGRLLSLSETFGVYGNALTPEDMRWICNYQIVRGIQIMNPMIVPYGREGALAFGERPYFSREIPGHTHLTQWNRHMNRISYFMSLGLPEVSCALYLPTEESWNDPRVLESYRRTGMALEDRGLDFELIDRAGLEQATVENGLLKLGLARYRGVIVPEGVRLPGALAAKLAKLDEQFEAFAVSDQPSFKIRCRRFENEHYVMVFNQSTQTQTGTVKLDTDLPCYRAEAANGLLRPFANPLMLEAGEECLILVTAEPVAAVSEGSCVSVQAGRLLRCRQTMALILDEAGMHRDETHRELTPAADFAAMVGPAFSGEIAYTYEFDLDAPGRAILTVERLEHSAQVTVNGKDAGYLSLKPWRLEVAVQAGRNEIVLTVANRGGNRYGATDPYAWFDAPHIGPYNDREQVEERNCRDGGLDGVKLEIYQ